MKANLDMGNNKIHNVTNDDNNNGVVNKGCVDQADKALQNKIDSEADKSYVDTKSDIKYVDGLTQLFHENNIAMENRIKKYVDESHITSSANLKDEFRYLMEDIDDSSSEINIVVTGITDLAESPHTFNKKTYDLLLTKIMKINMLQDKVLIFINFQKENIPFVLNFFL